MTTEFWSVWTNRVNSSDTLRQNKSENKFHHTRIHDTDGKGEELWLQSQEVQELSVGSGRNQLILKMTSEHQTVDHTKKIMGNDHDTIFVWFRTVFSNDKCDHQKHTVVSLVRRDLQIYCHFTVQNSETLKTNDETNTILIYLFVLSEQLVHNLRVFQSRNIKPWTWTWTDTNKNK